MPNIDYGNYADWTTTRKSDISDLLNELVVPSFPNNFEKNIRRYRGDCKECGNVFDFAHPVYEKGRMCPRCGGKKIIKR
jgi:rRNA maturation endonuclease Nob1